MHVEMSALAALTTEKDIHLEDLIYAIEVAVLGAYNQTETAKRHARAHLDRETGEISILIPIFGEDGTRISEEVDSPDGFSRVATSTARQIIKLKMRETNDAEIVGEFTASVGDVISGVVQQGRDPKMINVNLGRVEGRIPPQEQVPGEVYNHGEMFRDFTYVADLVQAIRLLIDTPPPLPHTAEPIAGDTLSPVAPWRVVNIGNSDKVKLLDFVDAIEQALGRKAQRTYLPMQAGDVPATWADANLLRALTGYAPKTDVKDGIAAFVAWYREYYNV